MKDSTLVDAKTVAGWLNVPPSWVLREARAGRLPCIKLGRYVRFERSAVEAWLEQQRRGTPS